MATFGCVSTRVNTSSNRLTWTPLFAITAGWLMIFDSAVASASHALQSIFNVFLSPSGRASFCSSRSFLQKHPLSQASRNICTPTRAWSLFYRFLGTNKNFQSCWQCPKNDPRKAATSTAPPFRIQALLFPAPPPRSSWHTAAGAPRPP